MINAKGFLFVLGYLLTITVCFSQKNNKPNVILIYADDLGYGDLSCYGATKLSTPNIDALANHGILFTNGHCTSATCTPSRYGLLTGDYPWRRKDVGILPGDAALIISEKKVTLPKIFKSVGYQTGIVGKWHLGLGTTIEKDWMKPVTPGPREVGFDYSFIFPATADRVPTIFLENQQAIGLVANDPIHVNYKEKIGSEPTGLEDPDLLKMQASPNQGHNNTIVNGIGRIGYMEGGKTARWTDEEVPFTFMTKAKEFIRKSVDTKEPFFLYFALTEPHVPRMPSTIFKGTSGLGFRGDAILQLDFTVGEISRELQRLGIEKNTIIIFSSDNGPVLDDGYVDGAVTQLNGHDPLHGLRGGKYSAFQGGNQVPFIVSWPKKFKTGLKTNALVSQLDLCASIAHLINANTDQLKNMDSYDNYDALFKGKGSGRPNMVTQGGNLGIVWENWKYIPAKEGPAILKPLNIETGLSKIPQLYDLTNDPGERINLAEKYPEKVTQMAALLDKIKAGAPF